MAVTSSDLLGVPVFTDRCATSDRPIVFVSGRQLLDSADNTKHT